MENENISPKNNNRTNEFIIVFLIIMVVLMTTFMMNSNKGLKEKNNKVDNTVVTGDTNDYPEADDINNIDFRIKELSIEKVEVNKEAPNTHVKLTGQINLEFSEEEIMGATVSGYCIGSEGEKYIIYGPADGRVFFYSESSNLSISEAIPSNVLYADGIEKSISEVDWNNVIIKSCKIDKIKIVYNNSDYSKEIDVNYEEIFN